MAIWVRERITTPAYYLTFMATLIRLPDCLFMKLSRPVAAELASAHAPATPQAESVKLTAEGVRPRSRSVLEKSERANVFLVIPQ